MDASHQMRIEALYLEMFHNMMAYARSCLGSEALAEEAVQETFRIACQKPEQLCGSTNPKGWLVVTLKNTIMYMNKNRTQTRKLVERYLTLQGTELPFVEDKVDLRLLYEDVADTEEFQLLKEMAIDGRSHEEMAKDRGISIVACKKRVQRAKETLRKKLEKYVTG